MKRWIQNFKGIEGLPLIIVASNALVYIFQLMNPGMAESLVLAPPAVLSGEYWRLLTFLFVPPAMSPIFILFWLYLLYLYAEALENIWGSARFTLYYLIGAVATAALGFFPAWGIVRNTYLNAGLFLAFTALFPNFELLFFFVIPMKVKYLGYFTWGWMALAFYQGGTLDRLAIGAAIIPYLIFIGPSHWQSISLFYRSWRNRGRWD